MHRVTGDPDADAAMRLSLGLMGVISPYATGPAPMYFGSGYIGKGEFWKFGLIFGLIYFAGLLLIVMPWLQLIG